MNTEDRIQKIREQYANYDGTKLESDHSEDIKFLLSIIYEQAEVIQLIEKQNEDFKEDLELRANKRTRDDQDL